MRKPRCYYLNITAYWCRDNAATVALGTRSRSASLLPYGSQAPAGGGYGGINEKSGHASVLEA